MSKKTTGIFIRERDNLWLISITWYLKNPGACLPDLAHAEKVIKKRGDKFGAILTNSSMDGLVRMAKQGNFLELLYRR